MEIKVNLPGRLEAELELAPLTLLLGPPKSGKTTLLRLIYDAFYLKRENRMPKDLFLILQTAGRAEEWSLLQAKRGNDRLELHCSKEECTAEGSLYLNTLFIPSEVEVVVKHNFTPPFEPYFSFNQLVSLLEAGFAREPKCPTSIETEYKVVPTGLRLVEEVAGKQIDIIHSSTAVVKLGVLIAAMDRGLLDEYDLVLIDDLETGLHPRGRELMVYLLQRLASCGKYVIAVTHDVYVVDMAARPERMAELFGGAPPTAEAVLYLIEGGKAERYSPLTAYIKTYTEAIADIYGIRVDRAL